MNQQKLMSHVYQLFHSLYTHQYIGTTIQR